jgi:hypothetical protein
MAWTAPRTWVDGETVTASIMNAHVRDNLLAIGDAWLTDWTPTLTGSTTDPTLGTGASAVGRYTAAGKIVQGIGYILWGSSGVNAGSGTYSISLPVAANTTVPNALIGSFVILDASTGPDEWQGRLRLSTSTTARMTYAATYGGTSTSTGSAAPVQPNVGDELWIIFQYEAA